MDEVITKADEPNSAVRGHIIPVLESGNLSYPTARYIAEFERKSDDNSITLHHRIEGAPLIERVIAKGNAAFVCTVASPVASYRRSHMASSSTQVLRWDSDDLGEPPMFTPMVVATERFQITLDRSRDGVHELWHGQRATFEKGMRLALSDVAVMRSSVLNMLVFEHDPGLSDGEFFVQVDDREGFRFRVRLAANLHRFLKYGSSHFHYNHIITHIASACFSLLKRDYTADEDEEGGWRSYRGLRAIADRLQERGLSHWSDDDFSPELAATRLHPHQVDEFSGDGDED